MRRCHLLISLIASTAALAGCAGNCCSQRDGGCGEAYWGAYAECPPPCCEPCNCYGDYVGGCGECGSPYPWVRAQARRAEMWQQLACRRPRGCCDQCWDTCETSCGASCTSCTSGGHYADGGMDYAAAPAPNRSPRTQYVSRSTPMPPMPQPPIPRRSGCNCEQ